MEVTAVRVRLCATLVLIAALGLVTAAPGSAAAPSVDQSCAADPQMPSVWASYTLDQSFTPKATTIAAWEVKLLFLERFKAPIRSRLVFNPTGDTSGVPGPEDPSASGVVVGEVTKEVTGAEFSSRWTRFELASPVQVLAAPTTGSYSIQVDFPVNLRKPPGVTLAWWVCGGDYKRGQASHAFTPTTFGQFSRDAVGIEVKFNGEPGTHQPFLRRKHHIGDFQFRVFSAR